MTPTSALTTPRTPPSPAPATVVAPPFAGLCRICLEAEHCTFPRARGAVVHHCDEARLPEPALQHAAPPAGVGEPVSEPTLTGLCSNCDHRNGCTLRRPEGGVWRCEEYA